MASYSFNPERMVVLIVDDHDPIRKALKRVLSQMQFSEVIETFDGKDAMEALEQQPVDLILCDIYMRHVDGFEFLKHVRNRDAGSDVPFIMISGEASREDIVKAVDLGADDYAIKPFQAADIEKKIVTHLEKFHSPSPLLHKLRQGERLLLLKQYADAVGVFDEVLGEDAASMRARHGKAVALQHLKRIDEAIEILRGSIDLNQTYYKNYATLANMYIAKNEAKDAIAALRSELELNPKQITRQVVLAKLLQNESDAMGAIQHYREALREDSKNLEALMGMGHAQAATENEEKALYYYRRARRYHPSNTTSLEIIVKMYMDAQEPKKAELTLRDEVRAHPERLDAQVLLAKLYASTDQPDLAVEVIDRVIAADEKHLQALKIKGVLEMKLKRFDVAANIFERIIEIDPSIGTFIGLGDARLATGELERAESTFRQALVTEPKNPRVLLKLANTYQKMEQPGKAFLMFRKLGLVTELPEKALADYKESFNELRVRRVRPSTPPKAAS